MTTPVGKGRPTPKRSDAQKRRSGPVPPPPANRKEAAKRAREQAAVTRSQARQGVARGDDRHLPGRDAGPVRALVRDVVDARRSVGVLMLPMSLLLVLAQLTKNIPVINFAATLFLALVLALAADVVVTSFTIRRRIAGQFPGEARMVRHVGYGILRSTVLRRFRMPTPRTSPGKRSSTA